MTEITEDNFEEYFFDVRKHGPKAGQVMARYAAVAEFVEGDAKKDIIELLKKENKGEAATQVMNKLHGARVPDCYRVCREIAEDILGGLSDEEILKKPYKFVLECFFYTQKEYIPVNDPHWETIKLLEVDKETGNFKSKIEI